MGAASIGLVACSGGDDTTDSGTPKKDSSADTTVNPDTGGGDAMMGGDADAGAPGDCGAQTLRPNPDAGPFCPFQAGPDGSVFSNCATGQHCCVYTLDSGLPSTCNADQVACAPSPGARDWRCDETDDCASGICCLRANVISADKFCAGRAFVTGIQGSVCQQSCTYSDAGSDSGMNESKLCGKQSDCPQGQTCYTFNPPGKILGVCL